MISSKREIFVYQREINFLSSKAEKTKQKFVVNEQTNLDPCPLSSDVLLLCHRWRPKVKIFLETGGKRKRVFNARAQRRKAAKI